MNKRKEIQAISLLTLVKYHKKKCNGDCGISLVIISEIYENLIDRELTEEETLIFM